MIEISFMSANWVARQLGYSMTEGWKQGEQATNAYFEPLVTYRERFAELLREVRALGFRKMDLWTAHLNWKWATDVHIAVVRDLLAEYEVTLSSYAGAFGETLEEFEAACRVAKAVGVDLLAGGCELLANNKNRVCSILKRHAVKFAYENHPEKSSDELLDKIAGTDEELIGVCVDTGWFGTQGYDAAKALREVRDRLFFVHLKDVAEPGAHRTRGYGEGCVPIERCVETLREMRYLGGISVEHGPEDHDPREEIQSSRRMLEALLA